MDISRAIAAMKDRPDFASKVGMVLIHNGVVRGWSRQDGEPVEGLEIKPDQGRIEALREEYRGKPGIYEIIIESKAGVFKPGDDLLFIIVAGDVREHVKPVLDELLDRIKAEALAKKEIKV